MTNKNTPIWSNLIFSECVFFVSTLRWTNQNNNNMSSERFAVRDIELINCIIYCSYVECWKNRQNCSSKMREGRPNGPALSRRIACYERATVVVKRIILWKTSNPEVAELLRGGRV